jgi:hypothetical protein
VGPEGGAHLCRDEKDEEEACPSEREREREENRKKTTWAARCWDGRLCIGIWAMT